LMAHKDQLDQLAAILLEKEVIFKDDLEAILGPRQWMEDQKVENVQKVEKPIEAASTPAQETPPSEALSSDNQEEKPHE
jgi:cell division protease FtsH